MKKSRNYRNKKKHLSSKYLLLILSGVCTVSYTHLRAHET